MRQGRSIGNGTLAAVWCSAIAFGLPLLNLIRAEASASIAGPSFTSEAFTSEAVTTTTTSCSEPHQALLQALAAVPEQSWWLASRNRFETVWTPTALRPLNSGQPTPPSRLITAWGGFAWDRKRSALWLFGGGHADYSGNEVYVWRAEDGLWQRASLPSEITRDKNRIDMAIDGVDNAPAAAHTYDNNVYLPQLDRLLSFGGAAYNNGGAWRRTDADGKVQRTGPYLFDVTRIDPWKVGGSTGSHVQRKPQEKTIIGANLWQNRDSYISDAVSKPASEKQNQETVDEANKQANNQENKQANNAVNNQANKARPALRQRTPTSHVSGCTAYAEEHGEEVVYVVAVPGQGTSQHLFRYRIRDLATAKADEWLHVGTHQHGPDSETSCGYDPHSQHLVRTGSHGRPFITWSLQQPGPDNHDQIITPADPAQQFLPLLKRREIVLSRCGLDYDLRRRHFLLWCGGNRLWALQAPNTATVTEPTPAPADVSSNKQVEPTAATAAPAAAAAHSWSIRIVPVKDGAHPDAEVGNGVLGKWSYAPELDVFVALQNGQAGNVWFYKPEQWAPSCAAEKSTIASPSR